MQRITTFLSHRWMPLMVIAAVTCVVYIPSLFGEFVLWDDHLLILGNNAVHHLSLSSIAWAFMHFDPELYIPLTFLSYQMDYALGGGSPFMFHFTNLLLHIFNSMLVFLCTKMLIGGSKLSEKSILFVSFGTALLFALHPIQVEAVAWASARKDVLSVFFFLLSVLFYLWSLPVLDAAERGGKWNVQWRVWYYGSLGAFFLSLLAKVSAAPLPVALVLMDLLRRRPIDRRAVLEKIPFLLLALLFVAIALFGKRENTAALTLPLLSLLATRATALQLFHFFVPMRLSILYPAEWQLDFFSLPVLLAGGTLFFFSAVLLLAVLRKVPERFLLLFGAAFFLLLLAPSFVTVVKGGDLYITTDRYVYLASIGVFLPVSAFLMRFSRRSLILAVLVAALSFLTLRQSLLWRDTKVLLTQALFVAPGSYVAHMNLGADARMRNEYDEAVRQYRAAYALRPRVEILSDIAEALAAKGAFDEAEEAYNEALLLHPTDTGLFFGRGNLELFRGKKEEAEDFFEQAIALDPMHTGSHHKLAILFGEKGDKEKAITHYRAALEADPSLVDSRYNIAVELGAMERREEARTQYEELLRIAPTHLQALVNYGILLYENGNDASARKQFQKALKLDPKNEIAKRGLALTAGK